MTVTITVLGAARTVTGSRYLIEADGRRVLVDCGLHQERELLARNWDPFPVPPASIDAIALTHAHVDHCGLLPRLASHGFAGRVFCTAATVEIAGIVLADAARLQEEDAETKNRRHAREGRQGERESEPLFTEDEAEATKRLFTGVPWGQRVTVAPDVALTFLPAGHILGAAMILVEVGRERKTLLFSGDLGRNDRPLVPDPSAPPAAGTVFVESTYGDRLHHEDVLVADQIATLVNATVAQGGSVLVPCFAVERAQELLFHLDALHTANRIPALPVFLDSPMALKILEVFRHHPEACDTAMRQRLAGGGSPFAFAGLHFCSTRDESKEINRQRGPAIIIAGSGMLNGGRIKHHLEQHLDRPESAIVFVGYQAAGTLGRQLVEGARQVRLFGRQREVRLKVAQIQGFSGHADRDELLAWLARQPAKPERIAVTHGGESVAPAFAALVQERIGVPAHAPTYLERIEV